MKHLFPSRLPLSCPSHRYASNKGFFRDAFLDLEATKQKLIARNYPVDDFLVAPDLYQRYLRFQRASNRYNALRNQISALFRELAPLDEEGLTGSQRDDKKALLTRCKALSSDVKAAIQRIELEGRETEEKLSKLHRRLPNAFHPDAPSGPYENFRLVYTSPEAAAVAASWGSTNKKPQPQNNHLSIGNALDLLDFTRAANVSGNSFYFLRNEAVLLEQSLIQYALATAIQHNFTPMSAPEIVREEIVDGCGFQPRDNETSQIFYVTHGRPSIGAPASPETSYHCLIGTSEIPIAGYYAKHRFDSTELPVRIVALSKCYRAEAGARGLQDKGLYRVHHFTKVEFFVFCSPEHAETELDRLVELQKTIYSALELPFRCVFLPCQPFQSSTYHSIFLQGN